MSIKLTVFSYKIKKIQQELIDNSVKIRDLTLKNMKLAERLEKLRLKETP